MGKADLSSAELRWADLSGADRSGVKLNSAYLDDSTNLSGTNLTGVILFRTVFADVDLTSVIGLETCRHHGPSMIDHQTLQKSKSLPLAFLRGVGLSQNFIDYLPSLLHQPIQFCSCFISYSSKDQDFADRLHADLQNKGVRSWFAPHAMPIARKITAQNA